MTLVFGQRDPVEKPATHVLIIGVGEYPYLTSGSALGAQMGLTQLTSAPLSARAFADWALKTPLTNPDAPIASVEMLLSPGGAYESPEGHKDVEQATMAKIEEAFNAWDARCHAHTGNVALFYYCGHGMQRGPDQLLLAEDFGAVENQVWQNSFNFWKTYRGMLQCKAGVQVYFIDACRKGVTPAIPIEEISATNLKNPMPSWHYKRDAPIFEATLEGDAAYAKPGETTQYTAALLKGLAGRGAGRIPEGDAEWAIKTDVLQNALRELLRDETEGTSHAQPCSVTGETSGSVILHHLKDTPMVPLTVRCRPDEAITDAALKVSSATGKIVATKDSGVALNPPKWCREVSAGEYSVQADFASGRYKPDKRTNVPVYPPSWPVDLKVAL
jgi:hypothetical protein